MPTINERLKQITLKVERAKKHASDLQNELRAFLDSHPYKVGSKQDPETRKLIYFVVSAEPVPDSLSLIAGDVIQNLMTALDHLAYQLVSCDTAENPPNPNQIYFPVADDFARYEATKRSKLEGASDDTMSALDLIKPYRGGNDLLWTLHRLNIIEKHRLLLTVASQAGGVNLGQLLAGYLSETFPAEAISAIESMNIFLNPADKGFPLKAGFELLIGAVDEKPNPKQQFRFDVALNEPGIVDGKPLVETLNDFIVLVEGVVVALTPRLN